VLETCILFNKLLYIYGVSCICCLYLLCYEDPLSYGCDHGTGRHARPGFESLRWVGVLQVVPESGFIWDVMLYDGVYIS
jgi:hypothetical protein